MNKIRKTPIAALLGGCLLFPCLASADPSVQFPAGNAAWMVEITALHAAPATPPPVSPPSDPVDSLKRPRKIVVTKVDNVQRINITWSTGAPTEKWSIANAPVVFKEYSNGVVFAISSLDIEALGDNITMPYDASAFSWVTPATLKEKQPINFQNAQCYHYVGSIAIPQASFPGYAAPAAVREKREAWIDSKTLLPVALATETSRCVFTFLPPPVDPLVIPEKFKTEIARYKLNMGIP